MEFALALPVLLVLVFGLIEFGRLLFVYMAVNNSVREAARYGIAVGTGTGGKPRFVDCDGIRQTALNIGQFAGMEASDITILYDFGPGNPIPKTCGSAHHPCYGRQLHSYDTPNCEHINHHMFEPEPHNHQFYFTYGDRIKIETSVTYTPLLTYMSVDVPTFTMSAFANRTIVKDAKVFPAP